MWKDRRENSATDLSGTEKQTRTLPNMNEQCLSFELSWGKVVGGFFAVLQVEIIFFSPSV